MKVFRYLTPAIIFLIALCSALWNAFITFVPASICPHDVAAPLLGARTAAQLRDNLMASELRLADEQRARLDEVSAPATPDYPYRLLAESTAERRGLVGRA